MKKHLIGLFIPLLAYSAEYDIKKTLDLTGKTSVTPTMINQIVDTATVATNKGMIIIGATAPLVGSYSRYTNFLWLDTTVSPPALKSWQTVGIGSDPNNSTNWGTATVGTGAITESKIAAGAVTETKLGDASVSNLKLASNAVSQTKIQTDAVGPNQIQASAVANSELADGAITAAKIVDGEITANKYADLSIGSNKLASASITADKLAFQLGGTNIAGNTIASSNLQANIINQTNLQANSVVASNITDGTITQGKLANLAITSKAWGYFTTDGSGDLVAASASTNGCTVAVATYVATVTFTTALSNANYVVVCDGTYAGKAKTSFSVYDKAVGSFKIAIDSYNGGSLSGNTSTNNFVVFGY